MQRRGQSGQPKKVRRGEPKARKAPTSHASTGDLRDQVAALSRELKEAREQQTATSEVLQAISSSSGDLNPVFKAILENATRICEAKFGMLVLTENEKFRMAGMYGVPPAWVEKRTREPLFTPGPSNNLVLARKSKKTEHVADLRLHRSYAERESAAVALADITGARTLVVVPMLKDNEPIGAIAIYRTEVRPFSDKQVELVTNFAAQAVIAIENARLLNELRQRTSDLTESLEQQTATSEVLKVISSSTGMLEPIFQAILENAVRICSAKFGNFFLGDEKGLRIGATHGAPAAYVDFLRGEGEFVPNPNVGVGQLVRTKERYHVIDLTAVPTMGDRLREATIKLAGARTLIGVPMLKDNKVVGAIVIYRQEVRPFPDNQIELVASCASQAVIAIENVRLLNELRNSLQQQTATADVLKVISRSTFDLQAVFKALVDSAAQLCRATMANIALLKDREF